MEKKLSSKLSWLQAQYPKADIEVWCEDEPRLGLQPILGRVWTPKGEQPIAKVKIQYEWVTKNYDKDGQSWTKYPLFFSEK